MNIALIGHGAMGKLIEQLAKEAGHDIACIIDRHDAALPAKELAQQLTGAHVAIDFTMREAVKRNVEASVIANVPIVEGTTGWQDSFDDIVRIVREGGGACVYGANFSIGVNLFYRVVRLASELFAHFDEYEVFLEEQHHSRKKDSPSGTALRLKDIVSDHLKREFTIAATRAGNIPGTHRVGFDGPSDQVLLEHMARSREGFALGALLAADWIIGKTGFFEFGTVMDEMVADGPTR